MDTESTARLIYLVMLATFIIAWFFARNRNNLNRSLQQLVTWIFLFSGMIILYGFKDELRLAVMPGQSVQMDGTQIALSRAADRHFYAILKINGQDVVFVVDTGATDMVLTPQDARKIGLDPDNLAYLGIAQTANGTVRTAQVRLDVVELAGFTDRNVLAWVNDSDMGGSLLGMSYLSRFSRLEIVGDRLYLTR